jgi:hypothetical protein
VRLLRAIADGHDTMTALVRLRGDAADLLAELAALELSGRLRQGPGGHLVLVP